MITRFKKFEVYELSNNEGDTFLLLMNDTFLILFSFCSWYLA